MRKINYDYINGKFDELIDIMIEFGVKLFVCVVGVLLKYVIEWLYNVGILIMNMVGYFKYVVKVLDFGVDMVCF